MKTEVVQNFGGQIRCIIGDVQVAYKNWKNLLYSSTMKAAGKQSCIIMLRLSDFIKGSCSPKQLCVIVFLF